MNPARDLRATCIVALALVALTLKLAIAYNTIGTNDAVVFYGFAKVLSEHGLEWTYQHSRYFNHPPLIAYYLRGIYALTEQRWCQDIGLHFPFLLRLPGIIADFLVVGVLLRMSKTDFRIPTWALALFALSPVSLMVSGFHGNTDPVMVLLLVCAVWMCLRNRPALAGLFFSLSCQIKIAPLLFLPAFVFFWLSQRKSRDFLISGAVTTCLLWLEPLTNFPVLFAKNVLAYGSYWGLWGITYLFRLTGLPDFSRLSFFARLYLARVFRIRPGGLSAVLDLACAFHSHFLADTLHLRACLELDLFVCFLQHHCRRFALERRSGDG
jgi:Glycosyltransferase family 87